MDRQIISPRTALIAAPVLIAVYGAIRLVPGSKDPGVGWLTGHSALFAGLLLFGVIFGHLYRLAGGVVGRLAAGVAYVGLLCSLGQVAIDLYVGATTADKAAQNLRFEQIQAHPGVMPAFYSVGPLLFYVGLLALLTAAAVARRVPFWTPLLVLTATVAMAASLDLLSAGAALYLLAFAPLLRANPSRTPALA